MTAILGVSCYFHDAAAALLVDGQLVAAAEEERLSRVKHDARFPEHAIRFCLDRAGLQPGDLDHVVFYEKPHVKVRRILATSLATAPRSGAAFTRAARGLLGERLWIRGRLAAATGVPKERVLFVEHHLAHAASAFFAAPFDEAAVVTVDGVGEWHTATIGRASATWDGSGRNEIVLEDAVMFPHSLGLLYSAFTAYLGFEVNEGEYKVMGMAPYGTPHHVDRVRELVHVYDDGSFWLDMRYFAYQHSLRRPYSDRFERLFDLPPRDPRSEFRTALTNPGETGEELERNQYYADVAASVQAVTEDAVVRMANEAHRRTGSPRLCLAGGVALNGLANGRLLRETPFEEIFIPPAPGDSGGALGAALYAQHVLLGKPRAFTLEHAYWGVEFGDAEIRSSLDAAGAAYVELEPNALVDRVADELAAGKVVGWFQGRFEWGPRALGNRSILADPRRAEMKEIINAKIKFREPFRPFAPAVLEERAAELVAGTGPAQHPARFMLMVLPLAEGAGERVPAVDHFGTARVQTVRREWNERFHDLVAAFERRTSVPVLLNTSFNLRGEPIVTSPEDALSTFERSGLDLLVLGNFVVEKQPGDG